MTHWKEEPALDILRVGDVVDEHCHECGQKTGKCTITQEHLDWLKSADVQYALKNGTVYGLIPKIPYKRMGYRARILTYWPSGYFKAASKQEALECIKLSHMLEQYAPLLCYFRARDAVRWQA